MSLRNSGKAAAAAPASGKELYPKPYFDFLLKERLAQGQPDTPELRNAVREELNTRELLVREAKKKGLEKSSDVKNQMELSGQTVLVRAYVSDWLKANPISDALLHKEYDAIKAQMGDKEYKVRHVLVEKTVTAVASCVEGAISGNKALMAGLKNVVPVASASRQATLSSLFSWPWTPGPVENDQSATAFREASAMRRIPAAW